MINGCLDVGGVGGGHGLFDDGVVGSEFDGTAFDGACLSSDDGFEIGAVVGDWAEDLISGTGFDGGCP